MFTTSPNAWVFGTDRNSVSREKRVTEKLFSCIHPFVAPWNFLLNIMHSCMYRVFSSHHAERFFGKVLGSSPGLLGQWLAAVAAHKPGELPKTFPKNLSAWWDGKLCTITHSRSSKKHLDCLSLVITKQAASLLERSWLSSAALRTTSRSASANSFVISGANFWAKSTSIW